MHVSFTGIVSENAIHQDDLKVISNAEQGRSAEPTSSLSENHPFFPLNLLAVWVGDGGR